MKLKNYIVIVPARYEDYWSIDAKSPKDALKNYFDGECFDSSFICELEAPTEVKENE